MLVSVLCASVESTKWNALPSTVILVRYKRIICVLLSA